MLSQTSTTSFASYNVEKAQHARASRAKDHSSAVSRKPSSGSSNNGRKLRRRTTVERLKDHANDFTHVIVKATNLKPGSVQEASTDSLALAAERKASHIDEASGGTEKKDTVTFALGVADNLGNMQPLQDSAEPAGGATRLHAKRDSVASCASTDSSGNVVRRTLQRLGSITQSGAAGGGEQRKGMLAKLARSASIVFGSVLMQSDDADDEQSTLPPRYKPGGLEHLCRITKFTKKEIQLLYRGFKESCPTGTVDLDKFKSIYAQFFPQGDCSRYATYVFNTFDTDRSGSITFDEFCIGLSIITRGTVQDKMAWVFKLYDTDEDGILTRDDLLRLISSIYEMIGRYTVPAWDDRKVWSHVDFVFNKMDVDGDGRITLDEFHKKTSTDLHIQRSLDLFKTNF